MSDRPLYDSKKTKQVMDTFENTIMRIYGDKGKAWLKVLPHRVQSIASAWRLSDLRPVTNLSYNYILSGFQDAQPIVLKVSLDTVALAREALALKTFAEHGAVSVLRATHDALLLDRAVPGTSLKHHLAASSDEAIQICCRVMQKLHQTPLPLDPAFPPIQQWFAKLDKVWEIPSHYLEKAREIKARLLRLGLFDTSPALLHGDLHHDNILLDGNQWKAIDPKGVIGHPIHEVCTFIMDIDKDIPYLAKVFGFEANHMAQCYFARLILMACWNCEDNLDPEKFLGLAAKVYPFI